MIMDAKGMVAVLAGVIRTVVEQLDELETKDNEEKAVYVAEIVADPLDQAIPLPPVLEQIDRPIIVMILKGTLKELFDQVWPEAA